MKVHPMITQISHVFGPSRVELYLIKSEKNALIDAGTAKAPEKDIYPALSNCGLTAKDIDFILNTHGHFDHAGGDAAVKSVSNARVLIHGNDAIFLENHERSFEMETAPLIEVFMGKEFLEKEKAMYHEMAGSNVIVDRKLKDNDIIELGGGCNLKVIHLPGHSTGSVGYYWEKEGILISGDFPSGLPDDGGLPVIWDLPAYQSSVKTLQQIPIKCILQGHDYRGLTLPPCPVKQNEEVKQYLQDCLEVAEWIEDALKNVAVDKHGNSLIEITDDVISKLPEKAGFKPIRELPMPMLGVMTVFSALRQSHKL